MPPAGSSASPPTASFTVEKSGIGITNTFCWSPDSSSLLFRRHADEHDLCLGLRPGRGHASANERPFFADFERGLPDGSAVDRDGYLWNARYGGGCVVRVAPDGKVDRVVDMPVDNITTCTFGGADLKTLYITTARSLSGPARGSPAVSMRSPSMSPAFPKTISVSADSSRRHSGPENRHIVALLACQRPAPLNSRCPDPRSRKPMPTSERLFLAGLAFIAMLAAGAAASIADTRIFAVKTNAPGVTIDKATLDGKELPVVGHGDGSTLFRIDRPNAAVPCANQHPLRHFRV